MVIDIEEGTILVASRALDGEPVFGESVIVLLIVKNGGIIGVNIAAPPIKGIYIGGPVDDGPPLLLQKLKEGDPTLLKRMIGPTGYGVRPIISKSDLEAALAGPDNLVIAYYAGWSSDQLAAEIEAGYWLATRASLESLLKVPQPERWNLALSMKKEST